jgi:DNA-binding SARP family transcriptional activator
MSAVVRVELFGGLRLGVAGAEVAVPSTRASVLLAALVIARGAFVGSAELRGLLWPLEEPASATNQLHRLVGQVRRLFEPELSSRDAGAFIDASGGAYRLDPSRVRSDLEDCDAAVEAAHRLSENGQWDEATEQYLIALEIVRHPLLGDATLEGAGHPGFSAVARTRVAVASEALACARRTHHAEHVVTVVEQIATPMPFEETLQAALIRALAQVGRRRDAMRVYDRVRTGLVEELGVDPGPELRAAHAELLRIGDDDPATDDVAEAGSAAPPAQLPASLRGMTARPEAQERLDRVAAMGDAGAVVITSIGGMGGIGKTTLAVAWAHSLAHRFPDGQLYVNLRGFDPAGQVLAPMDALSELLLSLGAAKVNVEESLEARSARFRTAVADRKLLLLLDNARDSEQVRPLLPHNPGCLVIVTSRNQLAGLVVREGAVPVRLDRMTDDQAHELLTQRLGAVRLGLEPEAVDQIIAAAAGLPLALAIVGARLAVDPGLGLRVVADELTDPAARGSHLAGWSVGEQRDDLASVFDWSYQLLDVETARSFRRLATHPGQELSLPAIASIVDHDLGHTRDVVSRLVGASLLDRRRSDRFVIHDLLREYAASRLEDRERRDAEARLVGHYVRSTRNAWDSYGRPPIGDLDPAAELTGLQPETFDTPEKAMEWYVRERVVLSAVLHLAIARGWDRAAANIAIDWRPMNQTVEVDEYTYPHTVKALEAAERTGDPTLRAELHRDAGPKVARLGDVEAGQLHLEQARVLYALVGDRSGEANALRNLATLPHLPHETAVAHLRDAIALVQDSGELHVEQIITLTLAAKLTTVAPEEFVTRESCLESERLLTGSIPIILARGWTYLMPIATATLAHVLMRLSRPREALVVASDGRTFAESDPIELVHLHVLVAESALACGELLTATQACLDFHQEVQRLGRDRLEKMKAGSDYESDVLEPFARISRVEAALAGEPSGVPAEASD